MPSLVPHPDDPDRLVWDYDLPADEPVKPKKAAAKKATNKGEES